MSTLILETTLIQVSLDRNIDQDADIQALVEEIGRLIEFSTELVEVCDKHLGS